MTQWIHPAVLLAIEAHEDYWSIYEKSRLYDSPKDQSILMCYAVHYDHKAYLKGDLFKNPHYSAFSPLITAIYEKEYDSLSIILNHLQWPDDEYSTAYWQGYGRIQGGHLVITDTPVSVWDAVFEVDDPKALEMLRTYCYSEPATLARFAKYHGAQRCYEFITTAMCKYALPKCKFLPSSEASGKKCEMKSYETGSSSLERKWEKVLYRACNYQGIMTPEIYIDTLLMWDSLQVTGQKTFLTRDDEEQMKQLLCGEYDLLREYCLEDCDTSQHVIPIPDEASFNSQANLHCKVILESWKHVLGNLDSTAKSIVLYRLTLKLKNAVNYQNQNELLTHLADQIRPVHFVRTVNLFWRMTEMLLQCADNTLDIDYDFHIFSMFHVDAVRWSHVMCGHLRLLVVYHYPLFHFDRWDECHCLVNLDMYHIARSTYGVIRSLLPHHLYETYRLHARKRRQVTRDMLDKELNKDVPDPSILRGSRNRLDLLNDFHTPRSLLDLCRFTLYQNTQTGKLPQLVREAEIPRTLKEYLTLGVLPVH